MTKQSEALNGGKNNSVDGLVDLHLHTNYSDGARSPEEMVKLAHKAGLSVISITDHDHVGAIDIAIEVGKSLGIEVISGVELSVELNGKDVHLLAYFIDHHDKKLLDYLAFFREERFKRAEKIVRKLNEIDVPLKLDSVLEQAGIGAIGRPHIANALLEEGLTENYQEAFLKYIGIGGPAYEKKYQLSPQEAASLVTQAGGLIFLAHPGKYTTEIELADLIKSGLDGIEVVHPSHTESDRDFYRSIAHQYFLLESGGSDYHGGKKNDEYALGNYTVPLEVVKEMRTRLFT